MIDTIRHRHWLMLLAALPVLVAVSHCSAPSIETISGIDLRLDPPGPTLNHAVHVARNMDCGDCHDPAETGEPKIPDPETCFECHDEDIANAPAKLKTYFESIRQSDGTYRFPAISYSTDLIVDHKAHAAGEIACAKCHGKTGPVGFRRTSVLDLKKTCMSCHEESGASLACATCHQKIRKDEAPASHSEAYLSAHGAHAPRDWRQGDAGLCAMCHEAPESCNECHRQSRPRAHGAAGFGRFHGRDALDVPFADSKCSMCHEERSCTLCHQREKPRSHTASFERRLHGISASVERQSCMTCHKPDFCDRCHTSTLPINHTGSFGSGRQTHCVACHDPLPMNGCYTCHKNTRGHLRATPLPPGPPHAGATDCDTCHRVLPHLNDGGNCRRCHR
jgi:predicted CXXCH cytochrome family protein